FQRERDFGNKTKIDLLTGEGGIASDEPGFSSHELDQANAVVCTDSFDVGTRDRFYGFGESGLKPETFVEILNIVVDCFRYPDDALSKISALNLSRYGRSAFESAIPS